MSSSSPSAAETTTTQEPPRWSVCGYNIVDEDLGRGAYGSVSTVHRPVGVWGPGGNGDDAMKVVRQATQDTNGVSWGERALAALNEGRALSALSHPNLLHARRIFTRCDNDDDEKARRLQRPEHEREMYIVLPRATTNLTRWIDHIWPHDHPERGPQGGFRRQALRFAFQLLCGLQHLHQQGLMHLDLKPDNLLLFAPTAASGAEALGDLKIADFGSTTGRGVQPHTGSRITTPSHRAPEVECGSVDYGPAADMWAAGLILADLLLGLPVSALDHRVFYNEAEVKMFPWMVQLRENLPSARFHERWTSRRRTSFSRPVPRDTVDADVEHQRTEAWCPRHTGDGGGHGSGGSGGSDGHGGEGKTESVALSPSASSIASHLEPPVAKRLNEEYGKTDFRAIVDLVDGLLTMDPDDRLTARQALASPLFRGKESFLGPCVSDPTPQVYFGDGKAYLSALRNDLNIMSYTKDADPSASSQASRVIWEALESGDAEEDDVVVIAGLLLESKTVRGAAQILAQVARARKAGPAAAMAGTPRGIRARRLRRTEKQRDERAVHTETESKLIDEAAAISIAASLNLDEEGIPVPTLASLVEHYWPPEAAMLPSREALTKQIVERTREFEELLNWKFLTRVPEYH